MVVSVLDGGAGAGLVLVRELRVGDRAAQEVAEPGPALAHPVRKAVNEMSRKLSQNSPAQGHMFPKSIHQCNRWFG